MHLEAGRRPYLSMSGSLRCAPLPPAGREPRRRLRERGGLTGAGAWMQQVAGAWMQQVARRIQRRRQ
eukprot:2062616-Prymnesium_polylepis.1